MNNIVLSEANTNCIVSVGLCKTYLFMPLPYIQNSTFLLKLEVNKIKLNNENMQKKTK